MITVMVHIELIERTECDNYNTSDSLSFSFPPASLLRVLSEQQQKHVNMPDDTSISLYSVGRQVISYAIGCITEQSERTSERENA